MSSAEIPKFDRFTDRARRTLVLASQEAMRLRHDHVGTEHLLLGLVKEGSGLAAVVLHQNGADRRAPRIEGEPVTPKVIALAPEVLDRYTGRYQLTPALVITITRQDARLFAQLTGQPAFEVFASSDREFFFTIVDAQLVFEGEGAGRATAVVLHQNGQTPRAPRID